jgi:hypothetical protein
VRHDASSDQAVDSVIFDPAVRINDYNYRGRIRIQVPKAKVQSVSLTPLARIMPLDDLSTVRQRNCSGVVGAVICHDEQPVPWE